MCEVSLNKNVTEAVYMSCDDCYYTFFNTKNLFDVLFEEKFFGKQEKEFLESIKRNKENPKKNSFDKLFEEILLKNNSPINQTGGSKMDCIEKFFDRLMNTKLKYKTQENKSNEKQKENMFRMEINASSSSEDDSVKVNVFVDDNGKQFTRKYTIPKKEFKPISVDINQAKSDIDDIKIPVKPIENLDVKIDVKDEDNNSNDKNNSACNSCCSECKYAEDRSKKKSSDAVTRIIDSRVKKLEENTDTDANTDIRKEIKMLREEIRNLTNRVKEVESSLKNIDPIIGMWTLDR
jgi:hypothetical protein